MAGLSLTNVGRGAAPDTGAVATDASTTGSLTKGEANASRDRIRGGIREVDGSPKRFDGTVTAVHDSYAFIRVPQLNADVGVNHLVIPQKFRDLVVFAQRGGCPRFKSSACNHPNCLVLPFSVELIRPAA